MGYLISSKDGRLLVDGVLQDQVPHKLNPPDGITKGSLSLPANKENILTLCDYLLLRFVSAGGVFLNKDDKWDGYPTLNVVNKYQLVDSAKLEKQRALYQSPENKSRGWCYLLSGTLHRFFYKEFDLYRTECRMIDNDYHWWLQDSNDNIIDLTEEQYLINQLKDCRIGGKKSSPLGYSYSVKTRNIAYTLVNELCGNGIIDINKIQLRGYKKS